MPPRRRSARKRTTSTRARQKELTKERIVSAALQLFEQRGFERTTTKAIATRARVAEGTVFNYFTTKEDIALHFFQQEVDHAIDRVRADARLRRAPVEEKLFALVNAQIEYLTPYEKFIGAAFVRALNPASKLGFSAETMQLRGRYLAFVTELLEEGLPGRSAAMTSWIAPQAFWLFYIAVLLFWLNDRSAGKGDTLAFVDRAIRLGVAVLRRGAP